MFKNLQIRRYHKQLVKEYEEIDKRLHEMNDLYKARREGVRPEEKYRPETDFFDTDQKREWRVLGYRHWQLAQELGYDRSIFWSPKWGTNEPDSPIAFLQVKHVENKPVEIKAPTGYGEERDAELQEGFNKIWTRDEEFDAQFDAWMRAKDKKFWSQMSPQEKMVYVTTREGLNE